MMPALRIGFALTGSFCTFSRVIKEIQKLVEVSHEVTPFSPLPPGKPTRVLARRMDFFSNWKELTGREPMTTMTEVEPIGPKGLFDVLVVAPCTGSTLGRLANGISETPVALAVKSHLRRSRPVVLAVSTNDALGASLRNIAFFEKRQVYLLCPPQSGRSDKQAQFPGGGFFPDR